MRGGHLKMFDQKNKFFNKYDANYRHRFRGITLHYTPHAFKHLDAWIPIGHPFWIRYGEIFFGDSKGTDEKKIKRQLRYHPTFSNM